MGFRPQLLPTLVTVPLLIVLIGLGTWQVQRLQWKQDLIDRLQSRSTAAPVPLPEGPLSRDEIEFQRVVVAGVFDHANEFYLWKRARNGQPGLNVLTPLSTADGRGLVLVNRGWIPSALRDPETRAEGQIQGQVTVEGIVRFAEPDPSFVQADRSEQNVWFRVDPPAMAAAAGLAPLPGHYIVAADREVPGGWPVGQQWRVDLPNNHLQYAITWYALAVALAVIYVVYHRRRRNP